MKILFVCLLVAGMFFSLQASAGIAEKYEGKCGLCHGPLDAASEEFSRIDNCPCNFHAHCLKTFRGESE